MGSNPAIPTTGTGGRVIAVLGADTAVGSSVVTGLVGADVTVLAISDDDELPSGTTTVVDAGPLRGLAEVGELASLDSEGWRRAAEEPMRRALHVLQAAHRGLRKTGGRIVVLLPSLVMPGAAGATGWAAAAEGYRSLAKAAARAWGSESISVQCVLVPTGTDRPGLQPPALAQAPELTSILAALLDERLDVLTGLTIAADGGVWMTS